MSSRDGLADRLEGGYSLYLYIMASSSRGSLPPKFNGMLWNTRGDARLWGSQHWWNNLACLYSALPAANHWELAQPMLDMYWRMRESCELAARQQWASRGMYIPETVAFNGLEPLPEDIAAEMPGLYLMQRPWETMSAAFRQYAHGRHPHCSRWNFKQEMGFRDGAWTWIDRGSGPFGSVTHIFASGAKVAWMFWLRYDYTRDIDWLRERAYPMLRGVAEFYRNLPSLKREADGRYHLHHVNNSEGAWNASDTLEELTALRGILMVAGRAAHILGVDADLQAAWAEVLANLADLPTTADADALHPRQADEPPRWDTGRNPDACLRSGKWGGHVLSPLQFFDLCSDETEDPAVPRIARQTFEGLRTTKRFVRVSPLSDLSTAAAILGLSDDLKAILQAQLPPPPPLQSEHDRILPNRLSTADGNVELPGTTVEPHGRAAAGIQLALVQSLPPGPGQEPVICLFQSWPADWDVCFTLLARGGFLVSSSMRGGQVGPVEIVSQVGGTCRLRSPWPQAPLRLTIDGAAPRRVEPGDTICLHTDPGQRLRLESWNKE